MRPSLLASALVAILVGFGSTIALVLAAAAAVGATPAETTSWILAVSLAKGAGSLALSLRFRQPLVLAWSTSGAALVIATRGVDMAGLVGAFVVAGALIAALGVVRPLARAVALIPDAVAGGMLAGVLLPFVLRLAPSAAEAPGLVLPMVLAFAVVRLSAPALAVPAALGVGLLLAFGTGAAEPLAPAALPALVLIPPRFDWSLAVGLALPLALVTMASQNLPGFAVLRAAGYEPPVGAALAATGGLSALAGLFGAHTVSMAAITASICTGEDAHPDRRERWKAGVAYGVGWVLLGLVSPVLIAAVDALPPTFVVGAVGLALIGPLTGALAAALATPATRFPAVLTVAVTASGVALAGIGAAFWGLLVGLLAWGLDRLWSRLRPARG